MTTNMTAETEMTDDDYEILSTPEGLQKFCSICYKESIERVCSGYTVPPRHRGALEHKYGPLPAAMARAVRQAAYLHLDRYATSTEDRKHPRHAGA